MALIIYLIGIIVCPILLIVFDKTFKGSMHLNGQLPYAFFICSFMWPAGIFMMSYFLLEYWHNH